MSGHDPVKANAGPPPEPDAGAWLVLMATYKVAVFRGHEVVRGRLLPHLGPDDPEVRTALDAWPGSYFLHEDAAGVEVVLVRPPATRDRPRWWLHAALFLMTAFTTHMAGALMTGADPLATVAFPVGGVALPLPTRVEWAVLARGAPFALPFLLILLAHEMGHYLTARRHGLEVSPPYFIPFPAYWSIVGTLGAFIRIRGPTVRRSTLLDVGAGGPLASFVLSIPVLWLGLGMSEIATGSADPSTPFVVPFVGEALWIGSGALAHGLALLRFPGVVGAEPIVLHPVAFAGWLGLFLTALNLMPLGQLDGGHVLHALSAPLQRRFGRLFLLTLLPLGFVWWGWWLWGAVAIAVNRGRVAHPPVLQEGVPPDPLRRGVAWACVAIFLLTFVPLPIRI